MSEQFEYGQSEVERIAHNRDEGVCNHRNEQFHAYKEGGNYVRFKRQQ
jgi:hypothetical protein